MRHPAQGVTAALPGNDVHSLYEKGYAALSQNDRRGRVQPADRHLSKGSARRNAQYSIGEDYRRGQYKNAADAFLKGYKSPAIRHRRPSLSSACRSQHSARRRQPTRLSASSRPNFQEAPETVRDEAKAEQKKTAADT